MPRYNFDYGGSAFSRAIQPGINDLLRGIEEYKKNATEDNVDIQKLQLESAKSGSWQGYQPSNVGTGPDPNVAQNYPDVMTEQGKEAYRMGGQNRVKNLQGISDVEKHKQYIDELSKRETMLGQSVDRRIKAVNASDTWFEKAIKDREAGNSSPEMFAGQIETAMEMSVTGGRDLSKYNLDVSKFAKLSDLKATLKNADTEVLANAYKGFLGSEELEDKIDNAAVLGKVLPAYKQKYGVPDGSYKFMDDALEKFNSTKFAAPKEPTPPMYIEKPIDSATQQKFRFNPQTGQHDIAFGKPYPIYKPEDISGKNDRSNERKQLIEEKKQQKKQEAKNSLDKWFTDAVTKAGGELAPTPDGGFEIVKKSFYERGKGLGNPKIDSLKTVYDKALKGIEKTYGAEEKRVAPKLTKPQLADERKQAAEAIKAKPELAEKIKAMYKQETGIDYE